MYNKLLITALATTFSAITFAAETPTINHAEELLKLITQCENSDAARLCPKMAKACPKLKALWAEVEQQSKEAGAFGFTPDQMKKIEKYAAGSKPAEILKDAEQKIEEATAQEAKEVAAKIAAELNIKTEPQE